jgi:hypothetical protein
MKKLVLAMIVALAALSVQVNAQSLLSGDIQGSVKDPSGAVMPNVSVLLKSTDTGSSQTVTTNQAGEYRFTLLKPGHYTVTATAAGFQKIERAVDVSVGQANTADLTMEVGSTGQTVEVSEAAPLVSTESSTNTPFTSVEVQELPSAGGDITNIADTAPGVVVSNGGGYGNFTLNGMPATSNLFTVNGENDMDPYFNINNTGATNLTLGSNEVQEATVVANPYAGNYGQLSGAQVTFVTKSGTNQFHGNLLYYWNGRDMNSNDWFNNSGIFGVTPRAFSNANQWAGSVGGPIRKNSTFFFFDTEGLRFVLPNVKTVNIPTAAFAAATLNNLASVNPSEIPAYTKMFSLYAGAPGAGAAQPQAASTTTLNSGATVPLAGGCTADLLDPNTGASLLPGFNAQTQPCVSTFNATPTALASEYIIAGRVDQKVGNNDNVYFRYKLDHGTQPTYLDPISPNFDALSHQPAYDMQLNETHIFSPTSSNQFMGTFSHYVAQFQQNYQEASSTFPYGGIDAGVASAPFSSFNPLYDFPQGRNISQYQIIDDFTKIHGNHNFKFGVNFRRYDVSDHNFFLTSPLIAFGSSLQQFAAGNDALFIQNDNLASDVPVALWGIGVYAMDEWNIRPNLKLTLALRAEHNANPVCQFNCFANFKGGFTSLASVAAGAGAGDVPYSSDISYGQHQAYPSTDAVNWSPRIGFSWSPTTDRKTVINGGVGIFYDNPAAQLVDNLLSNPPSAVQVLEFGTSPFASGPAGAAGIFNASAAAFNITQSYNQIATNVGNAGGYFSGPGVNDIVGKIHSPQWQEWSFGVQRQLANNLVLVGTYSGNHGINLLYSNQWANAFNGGAYSVPGLSAVTVPNYSTFTTFQNGAISNYNGLTVTLRKQFSQGFSAGANYTWSHNLDEVSNGGLSPYSFVGSGSIQTQVNPTSLRANNYGNSDYDIRNLFNAYWVANPNFHFTSRALKAAFNGWEFSGKWFWRSGLPYTVTDSYPVNYGLVGNYTGTVLGTYSFTGGAPASKCGEGSTPSGTPCINASAFFNGGTLPASGPAAYNALSSQTRNQFFGPHYFDIDMALYRTFNFGEQRKLGIGLQAFNALNHPNFNPPNTSIGAAFFGQITSMANSPTSPYGSFLGFDSSVRVVQVTGKFTF